MKASNKVASVLTKECVACGACAKSCPLGAICVYKGLYAAVDPARCVGCAKCVRACPAGVISTIAREVCVPC